MGRHKIKRTNEEQTRQERRWLRTRNAKRQQLYAGDPDYRRQVNIQNRQGYRRRNEVQLRNCADHIATVANFGEVRKYWYPVNGSRLTAKARTEVCLTAEELAEALGGYHKVVLYRWHRTGRFPRPTHETVPASGPSQLVYTVGEAKKLLAIMAKHQERSAYLRSTDGKTIKRLFEAVPH